MVSAGRVQLLNVLERLRAGMQLSYLFIAPDLAMVKQVSDRVIVTYPGRLCGIGSADERYAAAYAVALPASARCRIARQSAVRPQE